MSTDFLNWWLTTGSRGFHPSIHIHAIHIYWNAWQNYTLN